MSGGLVERIRLGWLVLGEADRPAAGGLTTHHLVDGGGDVLLLGVDVTGVPYLLIGADDSGPEEDVGVVTVRNRELETAEGQRSFVAITCVDQKLRDAFDHFLAAVVQARRAASGEHPAATAVRVLAEWTALLQAQRQGLSVSQLGSLVAELLVLYSVVARDPARSLEVWTGPARQRHDLRRGARAIEVKSTLSHTDRRITVHGVDQLAEPEGGGLTLAWHRLEVVPDGELSVFVLAERLLAEGASAVRLFELLDAAGSPPATRDAHDAARFELRECRFFPVDDLFPRLVPESFAGGAMPIGVEDLTYRVVLPSDEHALGEAELDQLLNDMAGAGRAC